MLIKSFFKILLGMALFACISSQSYAVDTPRASVMRAVAKAAVVCGTRLARGSLFIVRSSIVAANKLGGKVMAIGGSAITHGEASLRAWGFLVDDYTWQDKQMYHISAIEKAQYLNSPSIEDITANEGQSPGLFLATWFYGEAEPVIYFLYEQVFENTEAPAQYFLYGRPKFQGAFDAVARYPAHYPSLK